MMARTPHPIAAPLLALLLCVGLAFPAAAQTAYPAAERSLSDDEKLAQLLMIGFYGKEPNDDLKRMLAEWHVGGVALYKQNLESPEQAARLNGAIQELAAGGVAPFIALDQEGGTVRRLRAGVPDLPGAMAYGAARSPELARRAGFLLGRSLRALGFTMNFAPVLDVLTNPANTVLGARAFGSDAAQVARLGSAFVEGELESGIVPVAKHFPGSGGTAGDSHFGLPSFAGSAEELRRTELVPFRAAIRAGLPAVMTAHIALPKIAESPELPATLSHRVLTEVLRGELQFQGLVITDELQMRGIAREAPIGEVAVDALLAGADMILVVWDHKDREAIFEAMKAAYASGRLPHEVVERSLRRILAVKARLAKQPPATASSATENDPLTTALAEQSMTVVHAGRRALAEPVVFLGADGPLQARFASAARIATPTRVDDAVVAAALGTCRGAKTLVAAVVTENEHQLLLRLARARPDLRIVAISLGSPQLIAGLPRGVTLLYAYGDTPASQRAAAAVLLDRHRAPGRLPVVLPEP
jgi:beta-N-acetylhexosaminidase